MNEFPPVPFDFFLLPPLEGDSTGREEGKLFLGALAATAEGKKEAGVGVFEYYRILLRNLPFLTAAEFEPAFVRTIFSWFVVDLKRATPASVFSLS